MVSLGEALLSEDPKIIKRLRGAFNTQIISDIDILNVELSKKNDEGFRLDEISHNLIEMKNKQLLNNFEVVKKLHGKYVVIRNEGGYIESEQKLVEDDIKFMECLTLKVCQILDELDKFEKALQLSNNLKQLVKNSGNAQKACTKAQKEFDILCEKMNLEVNKEVLFRLLWTKGLVIIF